MTQQPEVVIVGVGYVGLTLAAALADRGLSVWGYDHNARVVQMLNAGQSPLFEPGLDDMIRAHRGNNLRFETSLPEQFAGITILCVSTPVGEHQSPDLVNLQQATEAVAGRIMDGSLVIIRSTVPVGTSRNLVLPILRERHPNIRLAFCPERTIQGQALQELRQLPQIVGAVDPRSQESAVALWKRLTSQVIPVSSLETAEMVKLVNNSHTDALYAFGNEVAFMAHTCGIDPVELIRATNLGYPRPDVARPGFVAGPCLSKDPHLLRNSVHQGYTPRLVEAARALNESLPATVARHFVATLEKHGVTLADARVLICGLAYKGWPITDDVRGTPALPIIGVLKQYAIHIVGHDYMVPRQTVRSWGIESVEDVAAGFAGAHGVLFVNEHPQYRALPIPELTARMRRPALIYDCWRMFQADVITASPDIHYAGIGYG